MLLNTRSDNKVMRLIFFWLYWQYCSPLTQTAFGLLPSPLAVAWLCNALVWSRCSTCQDVCKPCRGKGITEYRAAECHLFCVKLGENATTTHGQLQQAFGHHAMSKEQAFRWHDMFSEGRTLVEDGQRSGRPSTTRIGDNAARVREHVRSED